MDQPSAGHERSLRGMPQAAGRFDANEAITAGRNRVFGMLWPCVFCGLCV